MQELKAATVQKTPEPKGRKLVVNLLPGEVGRNTIDLGEVLDMYVPEVLRDVVLDLPVALNNEAEGGKLQQTKVDLKFLHQTHRKLR